MASTTKRFQTGREVFSEFIPDYDKQISRRESKRRDSAEDAHETAQRLLAKFKSKVHLPSEDA